MPTLSMSCSLQRESSILRCVCVAAVHGSNNSQEQMLEPQQLADMGSGFLHILTTMKHNGAIDKTQAGFTVLVQR